MNNNYKLLYLYNTSALLNDTSQVKNKQQEIPLRLFVKNVNRYMQQNITFDQVTRHKEAKCMIIQIKEIMVSL